MKIVVDDVERRNARVFESTRIDSDTVLIKIHPDQLMPEDESRHHFIPSYSLAITFEQIDVDECFWDKEPRICELELKIKELEN